MISEGCFQPSARDSRLRARQRNPRASRNTVCTWRHRGEPEPQHGLTPMAAGHEPSPGRVRRAQTGPEVAALHDRLRQLSRCAFAHQRRTMNHAQFARRRLGERASLRRRTFVVDAHALSESDATALRCSWLRHPHVGSRRAGCSAPTVNITRVGCGMQPNI